MGVESRAFSPTSKRRHYQRTLEPDFTLVIAREILSAKIYNQRRLVQRMAANRKAEDQEVPDGIPGTLDALDRSTAALAAGTNLDFLRTHEGMAAPERFCPICAGLYTQCNSLITTTL